ncbi:phage protein [Secundilactobacillus pentosiphilus]|uniref:Phage protein n=1 Tax=Secundilactobacillus pentosiphilus TaxID=1714682 RepID=A0A1Z5IYW7_9LACO|nr:hypothetical protein [Secundilactobacillus pentosiphilus]GAX06973.1 phage protein [Secundilactobacillus pentosiphilus]
MTKSLINIDLSKISNGALQEKFEREMQKVVANLMDPNTDATKKRKLTMTLTLQTDDSRSVVFMDTEVKSSLVPDKSVNSKLLIGLDDHKQPVANELKSGTPGQTFIGDDGKLHTDTGEDVDQVEAKQKNKVIDLQHGKEA